MSNAQYRTKYLPVSHYLPTIWCKLHTQVIAAAQNIICNKYLKLNKYPIPHFKYLPFFLKHPQFVSTHFPPTVWCKLHTQFITAAPNIICNKFLKLNKCQIPTFKYLPFSLQTPTIRCYPFPPTIRCKLYTQFITAAQNIICNKYLKSNKYPIPHFKYLLLFLQTPTIR